LISARTLAREQGRTLLSTADRIHRFPAKMTPRIALEFLDYAERILPPAEGIARFHDPMCGSATTALVARFKGFHVTGNDLLWPAVIISRAKLNKLDDEAMVTLAKFAEEIRMPGSLVPNETWSTAYVWFRPNVLRALQDLRDIIFEERMASYFPHLLTALFQTTWDVSASDKGVMVPTRSSYSRHPPRLSKRDVLKTFLIRLERVCRAQNALRRLSISARYARVTQGNALDASGWPRWRPSVVLTSPPYGCGLDYARAFRLQMRVLGEWVPDQYNTRHLIGRRHYVDKDSSNVPGFLSRARWYGRIGKRAPESLLMFNQYLREMRCFLDVARRRIAQGGFLGVLTGNPEIAGQRVPLSKIIGRLAEDAGFQTHLEGSEDRIKSRIQNFKPRSASAPIPTETLRILVNK